MKPVELQNRIINGRCEDVLKELDDNCIDFILTSPPYADKRDYVIENTSSSPSQYIEWFKPMAKEFYRVLKDDGSFVLNISDKVVNGIQQIYVFELVIYLCKELNFHLVRDYIWHNPATPPNIYSTGKHGRTKKSHEYCFWFSKSGQWTFNMDPIRKPYSKDMQKYLEGKGKGGRSENTRPSTHNFNCGIKWKDHGGSDPGSVISIGNTNSNDLFFKLCKERGISHPARFPEKLAEFFILAGTNEGDIVLDPFSGSGTTCLVAKQHNRRWIGIDANNDYCELASLRIEREGNEAK
nr:MAG TPA: adenine-specific methyltransferase [Caudoviricetes sp.]